MPSHSPTVLLTGFDPFGGETINPSWDVVARLQGGTIAGHRLVGARLPTAFVRSAEALLDALDRHRPALVLCLGQAGGRRALSFERVAINLIDARIADNDGAQPIDIPCIAGAPSAYFTALPIKAMTSALNTAGIAAEISHTAGTFVCNHVFYMLMHALAVEGDRTRGGFVHVPYLPEQAERAGLDAFMTLDAMHRGVRIAIDTALRIKRDIAISAGTTH